jgi:TATA-binding protein-associated factor Taf7
MSDAKTVETYVVVEDFTDTYGRAWKEGEEFVVMEDDAVTLAALEAGQIEPSTRDKIQAAQAAKKKAEEKAAADKAKAEEAAAEAEAKKEKAEKEKAEKLVAEHKAKAEEARAEFSPRRGRPPGSLNKRKEDDDDDRR